MKNLFAKAKCDVCGRFVNVRAAGTSSLFVPDTAFSAEESAFRCADCSAQHGRPKTKQSLCLNC